MSKEDAMFKTLIILQKISIKIFFLVTLILSTTPIYGDEYSDLYEGKDIVWNITPNNLIKNWISNVNILWMGKTKEIIVKSTPKGETEVRWLLSHHSFLKSGSKALQEPFILKKNSSGYFLITVIFSLTTKQVEDEVLKLYREPYFIIVSGKPVQIGDYQGTQYIQIEPQIYYMSDSFSLNFIK